MCAPKQEVKDIPPSSRGAVLLRVPSCRVLSPPGVADASHVRTGRFHTPPLPRPARIDIVSAILDYPLLHSLPVDQRHPAPPARRGQAVTLRRQAEVVALRQREAVALGCLASRTAVSGDRLVSAEDDAGHLWWIPAGAVWCDADSDSHPEHPHPVGLAMAATREAALVKGLSDRLGWEAVLELERGRSPRRRGRRHDPAEQCDRARRTPRPRRPDGRRSRCRDGALGSRLDVGRRAAPGPVRRRRRGRSGHRVGRPL